MKNLLFLLFLVIQVSFNSVEANAQASAENSDTWYVWIETEMPINGEMVKVISSQPITITCCVKSAKYRRFVQKTAKWLLNNISADYNGELELHKIQDLDLANEMIARAKQAAGVKIIDYTGTCN